MDQLNHNRRSATALTLALASVLSMVHACGRKTSGGGSSTYAASEGLRLPQLSPVPSGSREVIASPPPGLVNGSLLLKLFAEPSAKIRYRFRPFAEDVDVAMLTDYTEGVNLLPPVTIWAQAEKDGVRGPVRTFAYDYDPEFWPKPEGLLSGRLPVAVYQRVPASTPLTHFAAQGAAERLMQAPTIDGQVTEWSGQSRLAALDGVGDVPSLQAYADITWAEAGETDDAIYLVIALKEKPRTGDGTFYGVDFGPSRITTATFGPGTTFVYRAEVTKGVLVLQDKSTGATIPAPNSKVFVGDVVEMKLAKADLPLLLDDADVAIRPYTVDFANGPTVSDRMEPFFLRSSFTLDRGVVGGGGRPWQLDMYVPPTSLDPNMVSAYQDYAATFLPELERINELRFYVRGTIPLFMVGKEESGYAGLNTTDRGLLSTIGPMAGPMSRAQILAHELAHYQNARNSELKPRWLQEGMSEWSAERILYKHFPARAVHRFLKRLRFDRLVGTDPAENVPLQNWGTDIATLGYEKSLAFLDILETRLGPAPLIKAFQLAVNEPMDTKEFRSFLEGESGQDLGPLFSGWVEEGVIGAANHPDMLFEDADGDGLMTLDEQLRGTDPEVADTDRDGYPDGEEVFSGTNPTVSSLDPHGTLTDASAPLLASATVPEVGAMMRIGGGLGQSFTYSLDQFDDAPDVAYDRPVVLRPPYSVAVQAHSALGAGPVVVLERALYVNGVPLTITPPADALLPVIKKTTLDPLTGSTTGTDVGLLSGVPLIDSKGDMPPEMAAYDLVESLVSEGEKTLDLTLKTAAKPDAVGEYGDYVITFSNVTWFNDVPSGVTELFDQTARLTLTISNGAPYWSVYSEGGSRSTTLMDTGIALTFGADLQIHLDDDRLAAWRAGAGEKVVCIATEVTLDGGDKFQDRGGCVTLGSTLARSASQRADAFGVGKHTVEVFVKANASAPTRAAQLAVLGTAALREFEKALGRPLLDRNYWPVHVRYVSSGATAGAGSAKVGAFLQIDETLEGTTLDYLVVEQLARVAIADILNRSGGAAYWVQEGFIQWLTSAAMYALYPTEDVHDFHLLRLGGYRSYLGGGSAIWDQPLGSWSAISSSSSRGSEKSLAFALELNAQLGSATMSRLYSSFIHGVPNAQGILHRLKGEQPANATLLDSLWATWIVGSGNAANDRSAIRSRLVDSDGDGLIGIDETKLNTPGGDGQFDPYF